MAERLPEAARLHLAPGIRLLRDPTAGCTGPCLMLASGECVPLNGRAAELIERCNGSRTAQQLGQASPERDAAMEFLATAWELGWLIVLEGEPPDPARGPARR